MNEFEVLDWTITCGAEQIYASAEVARAKRDPQLFDDLVACLDRLGADANFQGILLHNVWTLASALHKPLIADLRFTDAPSPSRCLVNPKY